MSQNSTNSSSMSAMKDLEKTWGDKFGGELPASTFWIEDVKANLEKHRSRVEELKQSLKKEEDYVQFLESLLEEVTKTKTNNSGSSNSDEKTCNDKKSSEEIVESDTINDVINDTLQRRNVSGSSQQQKKDSSNPVYAVSKKHQVATEENRNGSLSRKKTNGMEPPIPNLAEGEAASLSGQSQPKTSAKSRPVIAPKGERATAAAADGDHFVTVIEVNGQEKKIGGGANNVLASEVASSLSEKPNPKPVPPIPPPKNPKRTSTTNELPTPPSTRLPFSSFGHGLQSTTRPHETVESQLHLVEDKLEWLGERNVVFDSRSKAPPSKNNNEGGSNSGSSSSSSSLSSAKDALPVSSSNLGDSAVESKLNHIFVKPQIKKKFEGSKIPLPPKEEENRLQRRKVPSTLDLQSVSPNIGRKEIRNAPSKSKISDMIGKLEGQKSSDQQQQQRTPKRTFERNSSRKLKSSDAFIGDYMDPCDAEEILSEEIYDMPPDSPASTKGDIRLEKIHTGSEELQLELEPMYDTVAPDVEEPDDDYVVLLEEDGEKPENSSESKKSASRNGKEKNQAKTGRSDSATIKSQTSVISSQSITTSSGTTSDTEGLAESPLPDEFLQNRTPSSNYVNIEYFLCKPNRKDSYVSESDAESDAESLLQRAVSFNKGTESDASHTGTNERDERSNSLKMKDNAPTMRVSDQVKLKAYQSRISKLAASESKYVEVLNLLLQYMKAMKATFSLSKPVLSTDDFNVIFYKIPELYTMHHKFLLGLQEESSSSSSEVGKHFETLAREVDAYGSFLQNYGRALDTVKKCSHNNAAFADTTRNIRSKILNINSVTLETLLHSPVSRIQKNMEIVMDLMKLLPESHPDIETLTSALKLFQAFHNEFKMVQRPEHLADKHGRILVKNSFIVELDGKVRKMRHLYLFNDVLVSAKLQASSKRQFNVEVKWFMAITDCLVVDEISESKDASHVNLLALRSKACNVRDRIKRQTSQDDASRSHEKNRKKLKALEFELVLASPNLVLKLKSSNNKSTATFFLSSEYERSQWIDAIETLKKQSTQLPATSQLSASELQRYINNCKTHLYDNVGMGLYLHRTAVETDQNLLMGDYYILIGELKGIQRQADLYICLEFDSYGHYFRKAKTKMICGSSQPCWNQDFVVELEGAENVRILLYEEHPTQGQLIRANATVELIQPGIPSSKTAERTVNLQDYTLTITTRFTSSEMTIKRVPAAKPGGLFGAKITQVCKREKRQLPFIITSCVKEVERRGINEVGIYRVSGSASDVSRLKKAFESNCYEAEQLLKEVDVNSATSLLKSYLRELPEALFTDSLYPKFFDAFSRSQTLGEQETGRSQLAQLFNQLPPLNQHIIMYLLDHMVRIHEHEAHNKMSLQNLAMVLGPTLLRPGQKSDSSSTGDLLAAGTADVIAQAGILHFFLAKRKNNEHLNLSL